MSPRQTGDETAGRILLAAASCFAESGYDATGVAEVCRRAGVSKGALYHHFPTKHALFMALLNRWLATLDEGLNIARAQTADVPQQLLSMASMGRDVFQAARGQLPMFLEFWTQAAHDPEVWQATVAPYHRYRDFFAELIRAGAEQGTFRDVDPAGAARAVLALALGLLLQGLLDPHGADWGESLPQGMRLILEGLLRRE